MLQRNEYQRLFHGQQHLEIKFWFHFMRAYKICLMSNIDQITKNFLIDFSYFLREIMNTRIWKIHRKLFPPTAII